MFKRKNKNEEPEAADAVEATAAKENTRGITSGANMLQRYWAYCLLGSLTVIALGLVFMLLVRESALQRDQVVSAAQTYADQQAASIDNLLKSYVERLHSAAGSPLALAAIASRNPEDLALVEKALLDYFPDLTSLKLVPVGNLGATGLERSTMGLRNHIELDLLRRAADGEPGAPESYRFESGWLTSFAQLIQHPQQPSRRAVILATLDNSVLSGHLATMADDRGRGALLQVYKEGSFTRTDEIAAGGSGAAEEFDANAELNGGNWQVAFTPSARLLSEHRLEPTLTFIVFGALLVGVAVAMTMLLVFFQRALSGDVDSLISATDSRSQLTLGLPQLVPLGREFRRAREKQSLATQKMASRGAPAPAEPAPPPQVEDVSDNAEAAEEVSGGDLPAHIFRAYDIRGIASEELNEDAVTLIGRALGTLAGEMGEQALVVGFDGRTSSPAIKTAFVKALLDSGRDVIDVGLVPTPAVYFAIQTTSARSGVMVTASHNPADYNGFKITLGGRPLAGDELKQLAERAQQGKFSEGAGRIAKNDIRGAYIEAIHNDIAITSPLKIVVDAGNGAAGELAPQVLESLSCEVTPLYCDIDGNFPNHHPDPSVDANLEDLQAKVVEIGADFGVAYDGDGDRLTVVDANGTIIRNDVLLMLFAEDIVSRNPGADVIFDIKCTRLVTQLVSKHGGRPILWRTGHAFMRQKMLETGAMLGGEFSGHFYFGERWYGFDDAIYATARLAEIISGTGQDLASLVGQFPKLANTPELHIPISEQAKFALVQRLEDEADFSPGKVTTLDGVRVDYSDGWGLLRASNTTPALIARFEGKDAEAMQRIQAQFKEQLQTVDASLEIPF